MRDALKSQDMLMQSHAFHFVPAHVWLFSGIFREERRKKPLFLTVLGVAGGKMFGVNLME